MLAIIVVLAFLIVSLFFIAVLDRCSRKPGHCRGVTAAAAPMLNMARGRPLRLAASPQRR
jgi:hypothetical protein